MGDLIWIGNTLLPRVLVFGGAAVCVLVVIAGYVFFTDRADA